MNLRLPPSLFILSTACAVVQDQANESKIIESWSLQICNNLSIKVYGLE